MGARYNISGTIDCSSFDINMFEVITSSVTIETLSWRNRSRDYQVIPIRCDIDCFAKDVNIQSNRGRKQYGGTIYGLTPIKITELTLIPILGYVEDISKINEALCFQLLYGLNFHICVDGDLSNSAFDEDISGDVKDLDANKYFDFYLGSLTIQIMDDDVIEVLDEYATGNNYDESFIVTDYDDNNLKFFDDLDDAISWAEDYNGYKVWSQKEWYIYKILDNGDVWVKDSEVEDGFTIEWINQNYDFDEEDY